jgi:hypothetical protein
VKRTTLSLIAGTAALAAVTGFATMNSPAGSEESTARTAAQLPVERSSRLCPAPSNSDLADTVYTSFTPVTKGTDEQGKVRLAAADGQSPENSTGEGGKGEGGKGGGKAGGKTGGTSAGAPTLNPKEPGTPVADDTSGAETPALTGTATGRFAPGWTVQQTTEVAAGAGRGLLGTACGLPDTEFWFPGASTAASRTDYVHLTNPDDSAAVVDVELYGKGGVLKSTVGDGITVKPHASEPILLSTLTEADEKDLTVHVSVRSGRVAAAVLALDGQRGGDWLAPTTDPAARLVLPGIPKDATDVTLVAFAPGEADADLKVRLASPSGLITPAGHEAVHLKAGMTTAVDLGDLTRGEAGSLVLTSGEGEGAVPVVAALRVLRGKSGKQETAFVPATAPVDTRASVAGNDAKGTVLSLTALGTSATVRVTASAGSEGGTATTKQYTLKAGATENVALPVPDGLKGTYALTVERLSGGQVYASRTLERTYEGVPAFTVQTLPDDRGTVAVPRADQDLSVLQKR